MSQYEKISTLLGTDKICILLFNAWWGYFNFSTLLISFTISLGPWIFLVLIFPSQCCWDGSLQCPQHTLFILIFLSHISEMRHLIFSTIPALENPCYKLRPCCTSSSLACRKPSLQWQSGRDEVLWHSPSTFSIHHAYNFIVIFRQSEVLWYTVKVYCSLPLVYANCSW